MALAALFLAFFACTRVQTDTANGAVRHSWTIPNTLRIVSGNVPRTLNPILATQTVEASIARLTTDILVSADPHGNLVPKLAREVPTRANGGISADGLTITYHLRAGVLWQDGVPFTSSDVKFSYDAIMNPNNDVISRHGYDIVRRVETPDPLTVVFRLKQPFAPFVSVVFGESDSPYAVLPAHVLAKYPNLNNVPFNSAPMGTGPFKFVRWLHGDRIEFVRNERYFLGAPKIDHIIWRLIPDENTELQLMRTHEADWMYEASVTSYKSIKTIPEVAVVLPNVNGFEGLMMNSGRGPTASTRVRRDIVMAIDKVRLTDELTYGAGNVATGDLPAFMWAYDPNLRNLPYDPVAARRDLAALGYTAAKPLNLDFVYEVSQVLNRSLVVQIQQALAAANIVVHPRSQLSSVLYGGYGAGGTLATGHYQLSTYQWYAGVDPDDSAQFACANRPPHGFNQSFYCSAAMDAAQTKALANYEISERKPAYATIESLLVRDAPIDFLWWFRNIQVLNPDLHGFDPNPVVETWNINTWSI
ncbi:MAG TPA: ABC transporter substrate-binding protein [Candidatus Lustribacter sp.]|nr:ABC transporter substrate-binding protein [Candidatus Lustribacter sp.]